MNKASVALLLSLLMGGRAFDASAGDARQSGLVLHPPESTVHEIEEALASLAGAESEKEAASRHDAEAESAQILEAATASLSKIVERSFQPLTVALRAP